MLLTKTKELYAKNTKPESSKAAPGKVMPIGIGFSEHRTAYNSGVKISSLSKYLDELLVNKLYFTYSDKTNAKILYESGLNLVLNDGSTAKTYGRPSNSDIMISDVLWEMEFGKNKEMSDLFHMFCKSKLPLKEEDVALFCDSYYQHNAKKKHAIDVENTLTREEIEASVRSGLLKKADIISDLSDLAETAFGKVKTVQSPVRSKKEAEKKNENSFIRDCKAGKFRINHKWTKESKELIPELSFLDDMVSNETFEKFVRKIVFRTNKVVERIGDKQYEQDDMKRLQDLGKDAINVTFVGKPGTGKSHNVHAAAAACGLPIYVVNCSQNTDEDRFEGMTKIVDGKPMAIPTEAVKCFKEGGILLLEEVNLAQSAVIMGALGQAVEYPYVLKQDGYKDIRRHPLCIVVSTMNVGTAGTKTVAQQFANRFKTSYIMDDPEKNEFIERLVQATGEEKSLCDWVYECYERITESVREDNAQADVDGILNALSVRTCIGAIENIQEGSSPKEAIYDSMIGKIAEQDAEVAENCKSIIKTMVDFKQTGRLY